MENQKQFQEFISTLPGEKNSDGTDLLLYQDCWYPSFAIGAVVSFQKQFEARDTDIIVASIPKSGTTWLKALTYLIKNRTSCPLNESPLLSSNPHDLVPFLEFELFLTSQSPDLEKIPDPRIFATHVPYHSLPNSITDPNSNCKIVYVCRNPLDQFTSFWQFLLKFKRDFLPVPVEEAFELYCKGVHLCGPFWNHWLGYSNASQKHPEKVLFLKYEDLKQDTVAHTKRLAEFLGFPFSVEEEEQGVIEEICRICSFQNLEKLDVNKKGFHASFADIPNNSFFRKGKVGDWSNVLTPSMADKMNKILQEKLNGSSLSLDMYQSCEAKEEA